MQLHSYYDGHYERLSENLHRAILKFEEVEQFLRQERAANRSFKKVSMRKFIARCQMNLARLNYDVENFPKAKEFIQDAADIYDDVALIKETGLSKI